MASATGYTPLEQMIEEEGRRLGRHTTVIIVTPSLDKDWVYALGILLQQGARAAVVLMDPESFGAKDAGELPADELAAGNVVAYLVRGQSDLSLMLGPAGVMGEGATERQVMAVR